MIGALYSKDRQTKDAFIRDSFASTGNASKMYVYPQNRESEKPDLPGVYCVTYEDVTKRDIWLYINNLMSRDSAIVFENPSRYPKISSPKFGHLKRLSMQVAHKFIVDIVPFTLEMKYLYTPLAYLDRAILGYAHYYAWRENYREMGEDSIIRASHDYDVVAPKLVNAGLRIDYPGGFLCPDRRVVEVKSTNAECEDYAEKKAELFKKYDSPQKIVTRLADFTHAMESRRKVLFDLLSELNGATVIYCNLGSYATRLESAIKKAGLLDGVTVTSYQQGADGDFANCIYYESPIIKSYYLLDAESKLRPDTSVFHFLSDMKVDQHLFGLIDTELTQINGLTKEMDSVQRNKRLQGLPTKECPASGTRADGMDIQYIQNRLC